MPDIIARLCVIVLISVVMLSITDGIHADSTNTNVLAHDRIRVLLENPEATNQTPHMTETPGMPSAPRSSSVPEHVIAVCDIIIAIIVFVAAVVLGVCVLMMQAAPETVLPSATPELRDSTPLSTPGQVMLAETPEQPAPSQSATPDISAIDYESLADVILPFGVTIGDKNARITSSDASYAVLDSPVPADALISVNAEPEMVILNVFPCDAHGKVPDDTSCEIIIIKPGQTATLADTMSGNTLPPGTYFANIVIASKGTAQVVFKVLT